jgi:hypothetical protein
MKHPTTKSLLQLSVGLAACLTLAACGPSEPEISESSEPAASPPAERLFLDAAPSDALSVGQARAQLSPGDTAVVTGQIGGAPQPFVEGYAAFVLADSDILFCDEMGDDHCPAPWDACCEDPDKVSALRASVQFNDAQGEILTVNLKGQRGLEELSYVTVTGLVADTSTPENLVILADGLYFEGVAASKIK